MTPQPPVQQRIDHAHRLELLAKLMARDLFTNGQNERATRLVLTVDGNPPRDLGGWNEAAVADRLLKQLRAHLGAGR